MHKLDISRHAIKALQSLLEPKRFRQVAARVFELMIDPMPHDSSHMIGEDARRITVGEMRIIYRFDEQEDIVYILAIGKRNDDEVYKRM